MSIDVLSRLSTNLHSAVDDAVKQTDLDSAGAQALAIIQLRTRRGEFLTDSGTERREYQSESHKKKRAKLGLPIDRVTLFMGQVGVLEAMQIRSSFSSGEATLEVGFIPGLSEDRASEIAGYLDREGVGKNKVTFPFVGLTDGEQDNILSALAARINNNLSNQF